jgi:iron complex outermembrane receptor protein
VTNTSYRRRCIFAAVTLFVSASLSGTLHAQADTAGTASIAGTVLDPTGNTIQSATVAVKNQFSGAVRTGTTGADGRFMVGSLPAGDYSVDVSAAGFAADTHTGVRLVSGATMVIPISMKVANVSQSVTVEAAVALAVEAAPSQSSLDARSAESVISSTYIRNFIAATGDYSDVLQMSPGTFSVSPNGPGLGDTKTFFRGFKDGTYNMTFDGLPFNDTNDPTHHSWVWFPTPFIGSTVFDRSPGDATSIGPANAGGSVNLLSREATVDQDIQATVSYGSFNTRMVSIDYDSGLFGGKAKKSSLLLNFHNLESDGYQTYNNQNRWAGSAKYQYRLTDNTIFTAFTAVVDLAANTPNVKGPTRAQVAQFGDNYLLNNNPADPLYYKFNFYQIPTDFEYAGVTSDLGGGWRFEDKVYSNRYYNHQQYNNGTSVTTTSATDKLNSYRKYGDNAIVSYESKYGVLRAGMWYEWANTDRFQTPTDPRTWLDLLSPNFHEKFITQSAQPYAQYEYHVTTRFTITAGFKMSNYNVHLAQYADNGKTIGCLGGTVKAGICQPAFEFISHTANYNSWQPTADARYRVKNNWSVYAQWATGNIIPPSSVFDVKNGLVAVTPKPTTTKAFQFGSVYKTNRFTLDADAYFIHAGNPYSSAPDATGEPVYFATADTHTKGIEFEGNGALGKGLFIYGNATAGSAKYADTHLWVASSPRDTETMGLTYLHGNWDLGFFNKRIGRFYNDNGSRNQAVAIDPFNITNLFFNYTVKQNSYLRGTKFRVGFNNIFDQHNIVGVAPASTASSLPAPGDFLTLMAGRSISVSATFGYAPRR